MARAHYWTSNRLNGRRMRTGTATRASLATASARGHKAEPTRIIARLVELLKGRGCRLCIADRDITQT